MRAESHIRLYQSVDEYRCMHLFDSNCPRYFADEERDLFLQWLREADRAPFYVMEVSDEILACGGVFNNDQEMVAGLAWGMVLNSRHGQGYGSQLTDYRLAMLDELFPDHVHEINTSQHTEAFYARFEYETHKVVQHGWGPGLHKVMMRKKG